MIVMKFGGTSVESAAAIERVASIVQARLDRKPVVVVSAMGKTTNKLLAIAALAAEGKSAQAQESLDELKDFHMQESAALARDEERPELHGRIENEFRLLCQALSEIESQGEVTPALTDSVSSFGERLSSLMTAYAFRKFGMETAHVDSRDVIVTDSRYTQAQPLYAATYSRLRKTIPPLTEAGQVVVMGGFIASNQNGQTTTLGRGGSDFTAAIVGAGIDAAEIQIWTDVDGMLTCDPRVLPGGHRVKRISFAEAAELAYFGAKVLHPSTVLPAIDRNIPVLILNSRRPEVGGTLITSDPVACANPFKSIACKQGITLLNIVSTRMLMAHGFLRRIFEVFDRYETPVDMIATSEVSVSLTIDNRRHLEPICEELRRIAEVTVEEHLAIVCMVGENIRNRPGIAARVFGALSPITVRMISQGASLVNLSLVVSADQLATAIEALHQEFFDELDPAVFE